MISTLSQSDICILDVEGDGLSDIKNVHIVVCKELNGDITKFIEETHPLFDVEQHRPLKLLQQHLNNYKVLVCHNIIGYDIPYPLEGVLGIDTTKHVIVDTLLLSRLSLPDRQLPRGCPTFIPIPGAREIIKITPHSVAAWGYRVGIEKVENFEWSVLTQNMIDRCEVDVLIHERILKSLIKETGLSLSEFAYFYFKPIKEAVDFYLFEKERYIGFGLAFLIETKVAFIIAEQERYGVAFNKDKAVALVRQLERELEELAKQVRYYLKPRVIKVGETITKPFLQSTGGYNKRVEAWFTTIQQDCSIVWGPFNRISFEEININSPQQIIPQLIEAGWIPTSYTEGGRPQLVVNKEPCPNLAKLSIPVGEVLTRYFVLEHRLSAVRGYLRNLRDDGRISAKATSVGTNTGRMTHAIVVNVPKASPNVIYGYQMRDLFCSSDKYVLCGHDASGLEAKIQGHYTAFFDGGEFARELAEGDIHTKNALAFFPGEDPKQNRSIAKNVYYALIYGASAKKIRSMIPGCSMKRAKEIVEKLWEANPALGKLKQITGDQHNSRGFLVGLDRRKVWTRSEHSALNAYFQSAGAIVMKLSMVLLYSSAKEELLEFHKVIDMHDEGQADIPETAITYYPISKKEEYDELIENNSPRIISALSKHNEQQYAAYSRYGELAVKSIIDAGRIFRMNVELGAEYKIGKSWAETH